MKIQYSKVTHQDIKELTTILGKDNIITEKHEMEGYSCDEMPQPKPHVPQVVVRPTDNLSISRLLEFANSRQIPVTPRGAGTGVSGGCIPVYGGILLSLERMNRILKIDSKNFTAVVEAGVTLSDLCNEVEHQGLYYPLYPGEMTASIGGNVATNAGGINAIKYGVTRNNVLGLEVVLPNGDIIKTGGEYVKCSTGYDLTQLFVGSEGTLAVITKVILKLTTKPMKIDVLFAPFTNLQNAIDAVPEILGLKTTPIGIEFMERSIINIAEKYLGREIPYHQYEAFLMVIVEGESDDKLSEYFSKVDDICKQHKAVETMVPGSERARRRLLDTREKFYHALKRYAPMVLLDVVVPRSKIAEFTRTVKEISAKYHVPIIVYGHAGDGNIHLHPICQDITREEWNKRLPHLMSDLYNAGVSLGGTISGEHGIGLDKKGYLSIGIDTKLLNSMMTIKRAFDPNNILNPGKIFDFEVEHTEAKDP
jgi:glycolate oxidase